MGRKIIHDYKLVEKEHKEGKSLKNISKETNIPLSSIYSHFLKCSINCDSNLKHKKGKAYNSEIEIKHQNYSVNKDYLNEVDSEDKAYFLGWMLSDGFITGKNRFGLKLKKKDGYIISEMFSKFSTNYKIYNSKESSKQKFCGMFLSSNKMVENLIKWGCRHNKTEKGFNVPQIPEEFFRHFIRGYFDGDGCIAFRKTRPNQRQISICSIDKSFLEQLQEKFIKYEINTSILLEKREGKVLTRPNGVKSTNNKDMYRIVLTAHKDKLKFYEFLYKNCSLKLNRKYVLYSEYYANTVLTLENKNSKAVQRIGDETIINYDLLTKNTFYCGKEVNKQSVIALYQQGVCEFQIYKQTKIARSTIKKLIKEYNSPTSVRQPDVKQVENIC